MADLKQVSDGLKAINLFKPTVLDASFVEKKIRECERRFGWKGQIYLQDALYLSNDECWQSETPPIVIMKLEEKQDWEDFVKMREWVDYKEAYNEKWQNHYAHHFKSMAINLGFNARHLQSIAENQARAAFAGLKQFGLSLRLMQNVAAITMWQFTGYGICELMPWEDNPYEPLIELLRAGYIARRVESGWLVGYRPSFQPEGF